MAEGVSKKRITLVISSFGVSGRKTEGCTYRWKGFVLGHNLVEVAKMIITVTRANKSLPGLGPRIRPKGFGNILH